MRYAKSDIVLTDGRSQKNTASPMIACYNAAERNRWLRCIFGKHGAAVGSRRGNNMKKSIALAGTLWVGTLGSVIGAEQLTSTEHLKCIEKSGGVTAELLDCDGAEIKRQDKRLNGAYQKIMASASEQQKSALRDSQRLWLAYRKTNCDLIYKFGGGGTLDSIGASSCEVDILANRVKFLEGLTSN